MTPFVPDTRLTAIALGFKNGQFISDLVAPRVPVLSQEFRWTEYNVEDTFNIPDTKVGRKGRTGDVEFGATEHTDSTVDYGLSDTIPTEDIRKAQGHPTIDPEGRATSKISELLALDREKRVASRVMTASNYNHNEVITGSDKWTDPNSKPIDQITDAMNTPMVVPNIMVTGRAELLALRKHPQIIRAYNGTTGSDGLVPTGFLRELFELDQIIVGLAKYNTAHKGQPMNLGNLWTGGVSLIYQKSAAELQDDVTFMLTASWEGPIASRKELDAGEVGIRGGVRVTVGDSVKEVLVSKEAGYFLESVI
jgi:hypothetical protein